MIAPMPGIVANRRAASSVRARRTMRVSRRSIRACTASSSSASSASASRAGAGKRRSSPSRTTASNSATLQMPFGATIPNSARCPRSALTVCLRCRTSRSRTLSSTKPACHASVFAGTKRMVGRVTASQIASASAASVLPRLTYGFT